MSFHYDRGLMFIIKGQLIRILDAVSGTHLHDIHMSEIGTIKAIKINLNYVVITDRSILHVYSLQALRNPLPSEACVFKIARKNKTRKTRMFLTLMYLYFYRRSKPCERQLYFSSVMLNRSFYCARQLNQIKKKRF